VVVVVVRLEEAELCVELGSFKTLPRGSCKETSHVAVVVEAFVVAVAVVAVVLI
jgi:hypothetical protein